MRIATPSSSRTFTDYSLPVSRRTSSPTTPAMQCSLGAVISVHGRTPDQWFGGQPRFSLRVAGLTRNEDVVESNQFSTG